MYTNKVMRILELLMFAVFLNSLWLTGIVVGLVFFGMGPSTMALSYVVNQEDTFGSHTGFKDLLKLFISEYKKCFIKSNIVFLIYLTSLLVLLFNFNIIRYNTIMHSLFYVPIVVMIVYFTTTVIISIPVSLLTDGNFKEKARLTLLSPILTGSSAAFNLIYMLLFVLLTLIAPIGIVLVYGTLFVLGIMKINEKKLVQKRLIHV